MNFILLLCGFAIVQVQFCACARIPRDKTASSEDFSSSDIEKLKSTLSSVPNANKEKVDHLVNTFEKFRENATSEEHIDGVIEMLYLAIHGKGSNLTRSEWLAIFDDEEAEKAKSSSIEELTENDLKEAEKEISKVLTPKYTQRIMKILSGFRKGATSAESDSAVVDLLRWAVGNTLDLNSNEIETITLDSEENSAVEKNTI